MLKTKEKIITVEDLAHETQQAVSNAQREPLIVTENGRPTAYLISIELFDNLLAQIEDYDNADLTKNIDVADQQFARGEFKTIEEAQTILEKAWRTSKAVE